MRSLTQRTPSVSKPPPAEETDPESPKKEEHTEEDRVEAPAPPSPTPDDHFVDEDFVSDHEDVDIKRKASPVSHRLSNTSNLDDVKLDDDHPAPHEEPGLLFGRMN